MQHNGTDSIIVIIRMSMLTWSIFAIFIACECGERLSNAFDQIYYRVIDELDWHRCPDVMWKMLPMFVVAAQQRVELSVIGSISCGRVTFRNVRFPIILN